MQPTSDTKSSWSLLDITPEARAAAERAAAAAGMNLDDWLAQLIKYTTTMQTRSEAPAAPKPAPAATAEAKTQSANLVAPPRPEAPPPAAAVKPGASPATPLAATPAPPAAAAPAPTPPALPPPPPGTAPPQRVRIFQSSMHPPAPIPTAPPARAPEPATARETPALRPPAEPAHAETKPEPKPDAKPDPGAPISIATDHLLPSRFAALASPSEDEIQAALEKWRASNMLEPLLVRPKPDQPGAFEIICGIERWHAARRGFVRSIPAIVRQASDQETLEIGIVDQLRRGPVSPLAEATLYFRLVSDAGLDAERIAKLVSKPAAHVAVMLRILDLPRSVRTMIEGGELGILHARALLTAPDPEALARDVVAKRLDIFQTEQLVRVASRNAGAEQPPAPSEKSPAPEKPAGPDKNAAQPAADSRATAPLPPEAAEAPSSRASDTPEPPRPPAPEPRPANVVSTDLLERKVAQALGVKCAISEHGGVGAITLHYANREELARIMARMTVGQTGAK